MASAAYQLTIQISKYINSHETSLSEFLIIHLLVA